MTDHTHDLDHLIEEELRRSHEYIFGFKLYGGICDFYIPKLNMIIEADGYSHYYFDNSDDSLHELDKTSSRNFYYLI